MDWQIVENINCIDSHLVPTQIRRNSLLLVLNLAGSILLITVSPSSPQVAPLVINSCGAPKPAIGVGECARLMKIVAQQEREMTRLPRGGQAGIRFKLWVTERNILPGFFIMIVLYQT